MHEAFDIPAIANAALVSAPRPKPIASDKPPTRAQFDVEIERTMLAWRDGGTLDATTARVIRRVVREAVLAALDGENELYSPELVDDVPPLPEGFVDIKNSRRRRTAAVWEIPDSVRSHQRPRAAVPGDHPLTAERVLEL